MSVCSWSDWQCRHWYVRPAVPGPVATGLDIRKLHLRGRELYCVRVAMDEFIELTNLQRTWCI